MRDGAGPDAHALLVGHGVLVHFQMLLALKVLVEPVEGPQGTALEEGRITPREDLVQDMIEAPFLVVVHPPQHLLHFARGGVGLVQGRERRLMAAAQRDLLAIGDEDVLGLRGEVEDHVHIERLEIGSRLADALEDLLPASVLLVAVHLAQKPVVEGLHAHGEALDAAVQLVKVLRDEVVRIRLRVHLLHMEEVAGQIDGLAQLVDVHRRRAAADVHTLEVVALRGQHPHLLAQGLEIVAGPLLAIGEAVEGAIGAQPLAEGNVHVKRVGAAGHRVGKRALGHGMQGQGLVGHGADDGSEHALREHRYLLGLFKRKEDFSTPFGTITDLCPKGMRNAQTRPAAARS